MEKIAVHKAMEIRALGDEMDHEIRDMVRDRG